MCFYRKEKEEAGSGERKRQKPTEIERQRDRESIHASMLLYHLVFVTIMVFSLVAFLGLATVPTITVVSVYIFAFDQKLTKKGFACLPLS